MASQQDLVLRDVIQSVTQRPQFDAMGRETQVVVVAFTTPHNFSGTLTMPLTDWKDPARRADLVFQAVIDLEGPFWEAGLETESEE
uniref:Uncharacterized protein n=2 Tax=viral metagenome TaxID=1070528 RepID=A0A6M3IIX7_9ZZZZ